MNCLLNRNGVGNLKVGNFNLSFVCNNWSMSNLRERMKKIGKMVGSPHQRDRLYVDRRLDSLINECMIVLKKIRFIKIEGISFQAIF